MCKFRGGGCHEVEASRYQNNMTQKLVLETRSVYFMVRQLDIGSPTYILRKDHVRFKIVKEKYTIMSKWRGQV